MSWLFLALTQYEARLPAYYDEPDDEPDDEPAPSCLETDECPCSICETERRA